jgi:hypothetical protein
MPPRGGPGAVLAGSTGDNSERVSGFASLSDYAAPGAVNSDARQRRARACGFRRAGRGQFRSRADADDAVAVVGFDRLELGWFDEQ